MTFDELKVANLTLWAAITALSTSPEAARAMWELIFAEGVRHEVARRARAEAAEAQRIRDGRPNPDVEHALLLLNAIKSGRIAKA